MDMTILSLVGALGAGQRIVIGLDGKVRVLEAGEALQPGDLILESQNESSQPNLSVKRFEDDVEVELDSDIENIFAALEEGADPTQLGDEFATAAGVTGSSLTNSGTIERDGEETIPETEFVTSGFESLGLSETQSLTLLDSFRAFASENSAPDIVSFNGSSVSDTLTVSTNEDTALSGQFEATDADGDAVTFSMGQAPQNGQLVIEEDGSWTYTPNADYNGSDSFTVIVSDGQGGTDTITINVDVTPVNDTPTLVDENGDPLGESVSVTTDEDTAVSGSLSASDDDNDSLSFSKGSDPSNGSVTVDENGNWTYTPNDNYNGSDSFTVIVSDGQGGTDTLTVNVGVTPVNDTPTLVDSNGDPLGDSVVVTTDEDTPVSGSLSASDGDNDSLSFSKGSDPSNGSVTVDEQGNWTYTPNDNYNGSDSFTVIVSDGQGGTDTLTVNVGVTPMVDTVTAHLTASETVAEGGEITYTVTLRDADNNPVDAKEAVTVTVTLPDGTTTDVVIGADSSSNSVEFTVENDIYDIDSVSGSITDISGGASFEKLEYNGDAQSTGVTDTDSIDTVTVDLSADVSSIAEGVDGDNQPNQITYTATLSGGEAKNDIKVTLANGEEITIKAGETSGSVSVAVQGDDVYRDGETIENSIKEVSEEAGNPQLESLVKADNTDVSVTVEDTIDTVTLTLNDVTVNEGIGQASISATLNHTPETEIVVTLDNGATITFGTDYVAGDEVTSTPFSVTGDSVLNVHTFTGGNFEVLDVSDKAQVMFNDKPTAIDFSVTLDNQDEAFFTFDGGQSGSEDNVSDQEDDIAGTPVQIVMLEEPLFGTIYDVSSGTEVPVSSDTPISSDAQLKYVEDINAVDNLDFVASDFSSEVSAGASSVDFLDGNVSISAGTYTGNAPTPGNVGSTATYLSYVSGSNKDGFGVSNSPSSNSELDVTNKEFISIDYSSSGAVITEANIEFGSVYSHYNKGDDAEGEINIVALDAEGNVVAQFNYDADEDNGDFPLVIDSNGVASVNVNVPDGFTELRVYTTQDGSDTPTTNSNITLKGVDVVSAELSEEIDYQSVDSSGLVSDEIAQLTIVLNDTDLAPVAQNDTVSVFGGLSGYYYSSNDSVNGNIDSVQDALDVIASKDADLTFDAKDINYTLDENNSGLSSQSQFEDFLNSDAGSVEGTVGAHTDGVVQMSGSVYLAAGDYAFKVTADDGYTILIDGVAVATVDQNQSSTTTLHDAFTIGSDGYHSIEIVYWDQGGAANLDINLGTVDSNGNYNNGEHDLNDFPLIGDVLSVREGESLTMDSSLLLANDYDPNTGDTFTIVADGFSSTDGTVSFDQNSGEISFTPNSSVSGTASFTYTIVDSTGLTNTATVTTMVTPISNGLVVSADLTSVGGNIADSIVSSIESNLATKPIDTSADNSDNHLQSSKGVAWVEALDGNDTVIYGSGDHMQVRGGEGDDVIIGNDGTSTVVNEDLQGGDGSDILVGGIGSSSSINLLGDDTGEAGNDVLISRSPTTNTAYYGGSGIDVAYLVGQSTDYTFSTVGSPDFRLTHTGTGNAKHDFYSIESLYFSDGKFEVQNGNLVKVAEVYELNIDIDLYDNDGSEVVSEVSVSNVPDGAVLSIGTDNGDGTWSIPVNSLDADGKVTIQVESLVGSMPNLVVTAGAQEIDSNGEPLDLPKYAQDETGNIHKPETNPNGDNTITGGKGEDVLLGDSGGFVTNVTPGVNYNIALVVDVSGSMGWNTTDGDGNTITRIAMLQDALKLLAADLASHDGTINLKLIGFEYDVVVEFSVNDLQPNSQGYLDLIDTIDNELDPDDGGTGYDDALASANAWFDTQTVDSNTENLTFFLTDGQPASSTVEEALTEFAELSTKSSVMAIGIGNDINDSILKFFDNTSSTGLAAVPGFGTETKLIDVSNHGFTNVSDDYYSSSVSISGNKVVLSDYDWYSDSAVESIRTQEFTVAKDSSSVKFDVYLSKSNFTWYLYNSNGTLVDSSTLSKHNGNTSVLIDGIASGDYYMVFSHDASQQKKNTPQRLKTFLL
jgi:VCBS repeat-containing protein